MKDNLPKFVALERIVQNLQHGVVNLDLRVRAGKIESFVTAGNKKTLYNSSEKDVNTNQTALEYIVKRISQQLESKTTGELVFKVNINQDKVKSVEVESKQTIK